MTGRRVGAIDLPQDDRVWNWERHREGSCVYSSIAMNLRQLGLVEQAEYIEANYGGGETASGLHGALDYLGWDYAGTISGDVRLLDWCNRTDRSAAVTLKDNHMCYFTGWVNGSAQIIDPNSADEYEYWTREEFLREWRYQGGWATAIVATPIPRS